MKHKLLAVLCVAVLVSGLFLPASITAEGPVRAARGDPSGVPTFAQATEVYVVVMADLPVASLREAGSAPGARPRASRVAALSSSKAKSHGKKLEKSHDDAIAAAGASPAAKIHDYTTALNGFALQLTADQASLLAKQPGVVYVRPDEMRYPTTDAAPDFLGLTDPAGPWAKGYDGEGVVVGVIDSGIWPEHPSFADDGSYGASPLTLEDTPGNPSCNFGNTAHNPGDAPFVCNNKLIGARQMLGTYRAIIGADPDEYDSARDDNGHGTHTASTAAGNAGVEASMYGIPRGTLSGIAPRARIIAYKALGNLGGFGSDLAAAIDQAVADGVDVINYSVGGGASLIGVDDLAFLFAADAGVFAATSAGNAGPGPETMGGPATVPWITSVGASTQSRFWEGIVVLGDGSTYSGASITPGTGELALVDAEFAGGDLCVPGALDSGAVAGSIVLCRRGAIARADKSLAVAMAGGAGMVMYNNSDVDNLFSDTHWVPSVHIDNTPGLAIKAYIAGDPAPVATIHQGALGTWLTAPSMTIFSSRGPNPVAMDIIKPDVTAPGIQILAGNSPTPDPGDYPGEFFQAIAGTSMSSPVVAGAMALLKQAHPDWSAAMAKSALMTTADPDVSDNDRISMANPFEMGAGQISVGDKAIKGSAFEPGLVYNAGFFEYLGFLCDAASEVFVDPAGTCGFLESIGVPTEATDLNLPSIGVDGVPGSYTLVRTVRSAARENGWRTYRAHVDAPPGFDVTVEPSVIRLKSQQSATFEVTFTNVGAPVGEWRFGALTWRDDTGHYDVRSPIAVLGCLFEAPYEVEGSGMDGSESFGVRFGYTGDYTAAPHGAEAMVVTTDNVPQDPDQTFNPTDGFSTAHAFDLTGAIAARFALPPDSTEAGADLDMFVYDPHGVQVASSGKGGTDELVDILLPENGVYTVYVHGWLTPGGDSDYALESWVVPVAASTQSVTAAPASAVIAETGVVEVTWNGLSEGTQYLGAVSHGDGGGILGLTLVNIDTVPPPAPDSLIAVRR